MIEQETHVCSSGDYCQGYDNLVKQHVRVSEEASCDW